jgi:hypothetical protein
MINGWCDFVDWLRRAPVVRSTAKRSQSSNTGKVTQSVRRWIASLAMAQSVSNDGNKILLQQGHS